MEIRDCINMLGSALFCVMAMNREMINHPCYLFNKKKKRKECCTLINHHEPFAGTVTLDECFS